MSNARHCVEEARSLRQRMERCHEGEKLADSASGMLVKLRAVFAASSRVLEPRVLGERRSQPVERVECVLPARNLDGAALLASVSSDGDSSAVTVVRIKGHLFTIQHAPQFSQRTHLKMTTKA